MKPLEKIASAVKKHSMLQGGETVLIGLSGGPDSVCLTLALKKLSPKFKLKLHAVYVDHGLRPGETEKEIAFCKELSDSLGIAFTPRAVDVRAFADERRLNIQEAARILRYGVLEEEAYKAKADRIAVGHTLDDNVETFLMRLLRGAGAKGLSGIPAVRGKIIRPLIESSRSEIEKFLEEEKATYVVDSSNLKTDYHRNKLRAELLPAIKKLNPNFLDTLSHTIEILGEEDRYIELAVTKTLMKLISRKSDKAIELFIVPLETMDRVILRRVLRRAIGETKGLLGISFGHIEDIIELIKNGKAGDRLFIPKGIRAVKQYSTLLLTSAPLQRIGVYELPADGEVVIREAGVAIKALVVESPDEAGIDGKTKAALDADKLKFPLLVRAREKGDYFYPSGFGNRKKLQDFFVDEKVPRDERDVVPVVLSGDEIIWVAGMRADERFTPGKDTRRFLLLTLKTARI